MFFMKAAPMGESIPGFMLVNLRINYCRAINLAAITRDTRATGYVAA